MSSTVYRALSLRSEHGQLALQNTGALEMSLRMTHDSIEALAVACAMPMIEVSEGALCIAYYVGVGEGNRSVTPDLACGVTLALAGQHVAPVARCEEVELECGWVFGDHASDHPQQGGTPGCTLGYVGDKLCLT
eukprot:963482-Pleurochrysis_carterae.AAC.2